MALCWQTPRGFSLAKIYAIIWRHQATISQYIAIQFFVHFAIFMSPIIAKSVLQVHLNPTLRPTLW